MPAETWSEFLEVSPIKKWVQVLCSSPENTPFVETESIAKTSVVKKEEELTNIPIFIMTFEKAFIAFIPSGDDDNQLASKNVLQGAVSPLLSSTSTLDRFC